MIEAGKLRHRIDLESYVDSQDSHGDDVKDWTTFAASIPAEIVGSGGRELFRAQQTFPEANAVIKIRYLAGVDTRMRVYHPAEGVYYNVLNVGHDDDSRREALILTCQSGVSDDA